MQPCQFPLAYSTGTSQSLLTLKAFFFVTQGSVNSFEIILLFFGFWNLRLFQLLAQVGEEEVLILQIL